MGFAITLDLRYKMSLLECYFQMIYGSDSDEKMDKIRDLYYQLVNEYQMKANSDTNQYVDQTSVESELPEMMH